MLSWKGHIKITEANPRLYAAPPKIPTLCLRAFFKCSLNSGTGAVPTALWVRTVPNPHLVLR